MMTVQRLHGEIAAGESRHFRRTILRWDGCHESVTPGYRKTDKRIEQQKIVWGYRKAAMAEAETPFIAPFCLSC